MHASGEKAFWAEGHEVPSGNLTMREMTMSREPVTETARRQGCIQRGGEEELRGAEVREIEGGP